jgi:hypothetical protein
MPRAPKFIFYFVDLRRPPARRLLHQGPPRPRPRGPCPSLLYSARLHSAFVGSRRALRILPLCHRAVGVSDLAFSLRHRRHAHSTSPFQFSCLPPSFSPKSLPSIVFSLPDGGSLSVRGTDGGTLTFPGKSDPVDCYVCPDKELAHNLVGASPLLRAGGRAVYTSTDVKFFAADADVPFLTGFKPLSADLWSLDFSAVRSPLEV